MDPNETLRQIRALYAPGAERTDPDGAELSELVQALDEWLSRGGFPPEEWREGPDAFGDEIPQCKARQWVVDTETRTTNEFYCTLDVGHEGDHVSEQTVAAHRWSDADVEPLGGPVPGVAGSHLPEVTHDDVVEAAKALNERTFARIEQRKADLWKDA